MTGFRAHKRLNANSEDNAPCRKCSARGRNEIRLLALFLSPAQTSVRHEFTHPAHCHQTPHQPCGSSRSSIALYFLPCRRARGAHRALLARPPRAKYTRHTASTTATPDNSASVATQPSCLVARAVQPCRSLMNSSRQRAAGARSHCAPRRRPLQTQPRARLQAPCPAA